MTDQEKVNKMFEIRIQELPNHDPQSVKRVSQELSPSFRAYWALLEMYNERYPNGEQGKLF